MPSKIRYRRGGAGKASPFRLLSSKGTAPMHISLVKGQKTDVTKTNPGLSQIGIGLGWNSLIYGFSIQAQDKICCDMN
jgi:hypothetical protein